MEDEVREFWEESKEEVDGVWSVDSSIASFT